MYQRPSQNWKNCTQLRMQTKQPLYNSWTKFKKFSNNYRYLFIEIGKGRIENYSRSFFHNKLSFKGIVSISVFFNDLRNSYLGIFTSQLHISQEHDFSNFSIRKCTTILYLRFDESLI